MYAQERQRQILDLVDRSGRVAVTVLAEHFAVTTETIRRDLDRLSDSELLLRVHGGAVAHRMAVVEPDVATRQTTHIEAKRRIGAAAAQLSGGRDESLLVDAGTTTIELVERLGSRSGPIITNALGIAAAALAQSKLEVHMLPGRVRTASNATVGPDTVRALCDLRPDIAFIGCNGISEDGFTTPDPDEAAVKRAMITQSGRRVVLADSSKVGTRRLVTFSRLDEIDALVTDAALPEELGRTFSKNGVEVILA